MGLHGLVAYTHTHMLAHTHILQTGTLREAMIAYFLCVCVCVRVCVSMCDVPLLLCKAHTLTLPSALHVTTDVLCGASHPTGA